MVKAVRAFVFLKGRIKNQHSDSRNIYYKGPRPSPETNVLDTILLNRNDESTPTQVVLVVLTWPLTLSRMPDILLVEDKESLRRVLRLTLENAGYSVTEAEDARAALNEIARAPHRIVLTDLRMPNGSGLDVLRAARAADNDVPVIVMTAFGSIDEAVQAMKDGAHDFLQKPVDSNHLLLLVERALEQARLRTENILLREEWSRRYGFPRILGESEAIKRTVSETQRVATTETNVLLLGESGTGK